MPILNASLQGRFGNQACQYIFARGFAEGCLAEFRCEDWVGNRIFDIDTKPHTGSELLRVNEPQLFQWALLPAASKPDIEFRGYGQITPIFGGVMPYTKRQAQSWLKFRPEVGATLRAIYDAHCHNDSIVAHLRADDYLPLGYPVIDRDAYRKAALLYFGFGRLVEYVSQEWPLPYADLPDDLAFLPDFYRLMMAPTLMRANSTFSFLAGLLGNGLVLSPRIDGLVGGIVHEDVKFEAGNHPKLANLDCCSELFVAP